MILNELTARAILEAAHAAWSKQDVEAMLTWYHDDLSYYCNMGGSDGNALRLFGKSDMRAFLEPVIKVADCISVPISFSYQNGMGRAQVEVIIRHRESGNVLNGTYRQILLFEDYKIKALEEFHDAARMRAFWEMVQGPANPIGKNRSTITRLISDALKPQPPFPSTSEEDWES